MPGMLSERIAALRKERGLTQEQLGKMAGVSSQAVGKWEKGGAPDVELLPVLSRQLGVTMDALFGLEGGEQVDVEDAVGRWLRGFPNKERMGQFCRLVWASVKYFLPDGLSLPEIGSVRSVNLEVEDGEVKAYRVAEPLKLVPFLYLTRCFMQSDLNSVRLGDWEPPLGPDEIWRDTKEKKQHEGQ